MMEPFKLLLVDDHEIFLDGLATLIETNKNYHILDKVVNGKKALEYLAERDLPDLLIADISMPELNGIELTSAVKAIYPEVKILILTMHNDRETVSEIMMAEAEGYILKNTDKTELFKAIDRIMSGSTFYSNEVMSIILERIIVDNKLKEQRIELTDREMEVLQLIAEEKSSEEIADILFISRRTVDSHRKNILKKTQAKNIVGLLKFSYKAGLISL